MKHLSIIFILISFFSCTTPEQQTGDDNTKPTEIVDFWKDHHCMRSAPIATLDTTKVEKHTFELQKDRAIEEAYLSNGNKISLMNEGCEVYWLTYTVYINNYDEGASHLDLVIQAFNDVKSVNIAPIDFDEAVEMLIKIRDGGGRVKLGNEYFLKMNSVSEMFEIDEISLKKEYAVVDFSFAIGKL